MTEPTAIRKAFRTAIQLAAAATLLGLGAAGLAWADDQAAVEAGPPATETAKESTKTEKPAATNPCAPKTEKKQDEAQTDSK